MAKWKHTLLNGKELKELISSGDTSEENCEQILTMLIIAYKEIKIFLKLDEYWLDNEVNEVQDDIDCAAFDEETVDYHLQNFYDTCDQLKVWVG